MWTSTWFVQPQQGGKMSWTSRLEVQALKMDEKPRKNNQKTSTESPNHSQLHLNISNLSPYRLTGSPGTYERHKEGPLHQSVHHQIPTSTPEIPQGRGQQQRRLHGIH
jgi:hypothetical protein